MCMLTDSPEGIIFAFANNFGYQSAGLSSPPSDERPKDRKTERPNDRTTERPNDQTTKQPNDRTTERPNNRMTEWPNDRLNERPTEWPTDRTTDQRNDQPTKRTTKRPNKPTAIEDSRLCFDHGDALEDEDAMCRRMGHPWSPRSPPDSTVVYP